MAYGTLSTFDTLAASQQTVAEFGEDRAWDGVRALYDAHNRIMREQLAVLADFTTDRQRRYGGPDNMVMDEVDEFGRVDAQKITAGVTVGFPLRLHQIALQWSRRYFLNKTAAEFAAQVVATLDAHRKRISRELRRAVFTPTNNLNYVDRLIDNVTLPVRALVNADGAAIPPGPNGEVFDGSTHTHYLATASFVAANLTSLIETVREHFGSGSQMVYINRGQEAAVRGFTGFTPYLDARLIGANNVNQARGTLAQENLYNRAIGLYEGAEIWVKPWIPANYVFSYIMGQPKPLVVRERRPGSSNLVIAAEDEQYPLRAQQSEAEVGVGVWTRTNGGVLYTGGGSYVAPTISD